jgi:7,8-dihydropterin-6-yl-methyl-4-(beta-D-ribofuranosyl)aminobenzene 5'-phosphate synthase
MKVLKITTLVENHVTGEGLGAEHGLSLLLEVVNKEGDVLSRHLFDTGQGDLFAKNAAVMNIDLRQIDSVFISHGHYDHAGGLDSFLKLNQNALVYIKESALIPKHNGSRFTGFRHDNSLSAGRLFFVKNPLEIYPGLFIMPEISIFNQSDTSFINGDLFEDEL